MHIFPVVVRCFVCRDRQCGFVFVEEHLDEDVGIGEIRGRVGLIEDELHVACHGIDVVVVPSAVIELFEVVDGLAVVVEVEQAHQWHDIRLMGKAQRSTGMLEKQTAVGRRDDIVQQVGLREQSIAVSLS